MTRTQLTPRSRVIFLALWLLILRGLSMAAPAPRVILFLGDSISARYRLDPDEAIPAFSQGQSDAKVWNFKDVNAGQSGDTSAGGLNRLDWLLEKRGGLLILVLGGQDRLRGS